MKRVDIPMATLQQAQERIKAGERYDDVAASIGVGQTALRGNFTRAGMQHEFGRRPRPKKPQQEVPGTQAGRLWDQDLAHRMLQVKL